jgi:SAM-dependent methyltransferase
LLLAQVPPGGAVLDLGCGNGLPTVRQLASQCRVTGVDISARQIERARRNVPTAAFIHGDMTRLTFPPGHFDAAIAFYSLTHLPHGELPGLLARIASWLRPGGLFIASMGAATNPGMVEADWLGAPMYFSGYSLEEGRAIVEGAGLDILGMTPETILEDGDPVVFAWVVARRHPSEL